MIDQLLDEAISADELAPQLRVKTFTIELGWPERSGIGFSARYHALCIAERRACDSYLVQVAQPRAPWSWPSLVDDLLADDQLPSDAVVTGVGQVVGQSDLFVRYLQPRR